MSLEHRLDALDPNQRAICEAILKLLPRIGDIHVEPVNVGFFLKRGRTFASLRLRQKGIRLLIMLPRPLDHPRLSYSRRGEKRGSRIAHATTLQSAAEVDDDVRAWLAESYASSQA
jgi:hypothetical protein